MEEKQGGKAPHRCFRIPTDQWERVKAAVAWNGDESVSALVRQFLRGYARAVERRQAEGKEPAPGSFTAQPRKVQKRQDPRPR